MHLHRLLIAAAAAAALALPASAAAAPAGSLDTSFSGDGLATLPFGPGTLGVAEHVAAAPDGSYVAVGTRLKSGDSDPWVIARFRADGTPDPGFGDGGTVIVDLGEEADAAGVAVLTDGRIVVGGHAEVDGADTDLVTLRLLPDGERDATNGDAGGISGLRAISRTATSEERSGAITVDAQDRVHFGGSIVEQGIPGSRLLAVRLTAAGAPDTGFDIDGFYSREVDGDRLEMVSGIAAHGDRVTIAGHVLADDGRAFVTRTNVALVNGPDQDFGFHGLAMVGPVGQQTEAYGLAVLPGGAVRLTAAQDGHDVLYGLTAGGDADPGFGTGGSVPRGPTSSMQTEARGIQALPGGGLAVAGLEVDAAGRILGEVRRLRADGSPDPSFSGDGSMTLASVAGVSAVGPIVVEPDGDLVVAGAAGRSEGEFDLALARINGSDKPDPAQPAAPAAPAADQPPAPAAPGGADAPKPAAAPRAAVVRAADVIALPAAKRCLSKRTVAFRLRAPRGGRIVAATVRVGTGRTRTISGRRLTGAATSLKGLPKGTVKVVVKATLASGERLTLTRTYKTCAKKGKR